MRDSSTGAGGAAYQPPEPTLRELLTLLDWVREHVQRTEGNPADPQTVTATLSLLDGAGAILEVHRPGTLPDGALYCAVCLGETGNRAWQCQTVRAFGLAVLRHWLPRVPPQDRPEPARHPSETRGPRIPPWAR